MDSYDDRHLQHLGKVRIFSLNQIGECLKYDPRLQCFVLARKGSIFDLFAHSESYAALPDFREHSCITVSLKIDQKFLAVDSRSGKAHLIDPNTPRCIPASAVFKYWKKKFDRFSASISHNDNTEIWLRHSNSTLRVCNYVYTHENVPV
jgi:hypothetical protein